MKPTVKIWMPLYIGDYLSDTMHLTTEQHGAYLLLLMAYWKNCGPLPVERLQPIVKLNGSEWKNAQALLKEYFDTESKPGKWVHHRADREIAEACKNREILSSRGLAGAEGRWKGHKKRDA